MTSTPDYFVLFADMLGFKQLVLQHRVPYPENLEFRGRIFARPERPNPPAATGNPLGEAFRTFHRTANDCLNYKVWRAPVSVIIFSDSLFLATTDAEDGMEFTETMMIKGLNRGMPLRMGIGRQYSELWRATTHSLGFSGIWDNIRRHGIVLPAVQAREELRAAIDSVSNEPGLQNAWLDILMRQFRFEDREVAYVQRRWEYEMKPLRTFAPYAFHCLKVWIGLVFVVHNKLFKWGPTHVVDMQYLNYLAFCQVFSSNDTLHKILAPALIRDDQTFLTGDELKKASRDEEDAWEALGEEKNRRLNWAFGSPLPRRGELLWETWRRYMRPSVGNNRVCHLSDGQRALAIEEATTMLNEALAEPVRG